MGKLDGKVAVITGSTRGLGLGIAQAYAAEGETVVISSRTTAAVERVVADFQAAGYQASGLACDVGDRAEVEALAQHAIERWGHFDIWVNNAGLPAPTGQPLRCRPPTSKWCWIPTFAARTTARGRRSCTSRRGAAAS